MLSGRRQTLRPNLAANAKVLDEALVTIGVTGLEVIQESTAGTDHFDQAMTGTMILLVLLQMLRQLLDAFCQHRNLNVRGSCVAFMPLKLPLNR